MLRNYFKITIRNLFKRKIFSIVHILGLGIAFAISLLLLLTAFFEFSYDQFHTRADNIYQLYTEEHKPHGIKENATMPSPMKPAFEKEVSGIVAVTRLVEGAATIKRGEVILGSDLYYTDPEFFKIFSFKLIRGNASTALQDLNSAVLSQKSAEMLFGSEDPMGKLLEINATGEYESFVVKGVTENTPRNSTMEFDIFLPFQNNPDYKENINEWDNKYHNVFILKDKNISAATIENRTKPFIKKYLAEEINNLKRDGAKPDHEGEYIRLKLLPLTDLHFSSISPLGSSLPAFYPWVLIIISLFILFIASTNFINLSLATSFIRSKEIGMRKTLGAFKHQLIFQFWGEAFLICLLALLFAGGIDYFLCRFYTADTKDLPFELLFAPQTLIVLIVGFFAITAIAGGYPALVMSRFNTVSALKGKLMASTKNRLRNSLIVFQFFIAIVLIVATIVILLQLNYIRSLPLGFNKYEVVSIPLGNNISPEQGMGRMRSKLAGIANVVSISGSGRNLGRGRDGSISDGRIGFDYKNREVTANYYTIDYDYIKTLELSLTKGRDFSRSFSADKNSVIINEKMAALLEEKEALEVNLNISDDENWKVIGVVKDFNYQPLTSEVEPLMMRLEPESAAYIFVKVRPHNLPETLKAIQSAWNEVNPEASGEASFLDENIDQLYKKEERLSAIFLGGAGLAIFISCLGLFALALLIMTQRTKEIGVRKVLGASVSGILGLVLKDFVKLVGIAFIIASPVVWFFMHKFLESYAYRINMSAWILLLGGAIVLAVAILTVSIHAIKAAIANPVKSLRTE